MIEEIRKIRDSNGAFAAVFTAFSKTFDCVPHELLLAKLYAYGFDKISLSLIHAYLIQMKQKTKVGSTFGGDLLNILFGVPKGSN